MYITLVEFVPHIASRSLPLFARKGFFIHGGVSVLAQLDLAAINGDLCFQGVMDRGQNKHLGRCWRVCKATAL